MKILSVTPKRNARGDWWLIETDDPAQPKVSTESMFAASFADQALVNQWDVNITSASGWYYRSLLTITRVSGTALPGHDVTYRVSDEADPHSGGC